VNWASSASANRRKCFQEFSLQRTYAFNFKTLGNKTQLGEWLLGVLEENPYLTIDGIMKAMMAKHG
jgi:hypothetical protein